MLARTPGKSKATGQPPFGKYFICSLLEFIELIIRKGRGTQAQQHVMKLDMFRWDNYTSLSLWGGL